MLIDLRAVADPVDLAADVCIAGAGAAGITLARRLAALGIDVCLLEGGGFDYEADTQALCAGANLGMPYYALEEARLRFFGGTTNIWGGRCALMDAIDFETRPWVPHSGWPITLDDLLPYYRSAHEALDLGELRYTGTTDVPFDPALLGIRLWRFDERHERFGIRSCADLLSSPRVKVVVHANVTHVQARPEARAVTALTVRALGGTAHTVRARQFVLACGAIENARLLLASRDVEPAGIGNGHDQVGRYFMEHPHGRIGILEGGPAYTLWQAFRKRFPAAGPPVAPALVLAVSRQRAAGALNSAVTFKLQRDPARGVSLDKRAYLHLKHRLAPDRRGRRAHHAYRSLRAGFQRRLRPPLERLRAALGITGLHVIIRGEQAPNPESRVTLAAERDALGLPRAELRWRLTALDKHTGMVMADTLDRELGRLGLGRIRKPAWLEEAGLEWPVDATVSNHPIGGYHHMGTTRMSADPRHGVVDAHCRVHGYGNLYVAGSSVFATAGWANPTLTILALAHRLAGTLHRAGSVPPATLPGPLVAPGVADEGRPADKAEDDAVQQ